MTTAYEPGLDQILHDFHAQDKDSLGALSISIYTLGYCIGHLIVAPVSKVYGRICLLRSHCATYHAKGEEGDSVGCNVDRCWPGTSTFLLSNSAFPPPSFSPSFFRQTEISR
jgi:hypothetical protein